MYKNIRLKEIREKNELTIRQVAKILKISKSTYSAYENDKYTITIRNLLKFCAYFKVSTDYALGFSKINYYSSNNNYQYRQKLIGERIKQVIINEKLTQAKFSDDIHLPQSSLSCYIHGKVKIKMDIITQIHRNYHYSIDYLLGVTNYRMVIPN